MLNQSDRKTNSVNESVAYTDYINAKSKMALYYGTIGLKLEQLKSERHENTLLQSIYDALIDMDTQIQLLERMNKKQRDTWYLIATKVLDSLHTGMTKPSLQQPQIFLDAAYQLRNDSYIHSGPSLGLARFLSCISLLGILIAAAGLTSLFYSLATPLGAGILLGLGLFICLSYGLAASASYQYNVTQLIEKSNKCNSKIQSMGFLLHSAAINSEKDAFILARAPESLRI
ncbi:MAG: hypothetical protein Q8R24_02785 [Legionellaceae bacterium]|nr:hypothetical protein [Legionellaceae bacterium]